MTTPGRSRLGWWLYVAVLAAAALYVAHSFVGILVLGVFGYYAARPICDRLSVVVDSERLAAALTVVTVLTPVFLVVCYALFRAVRQANRLFDGNVVSTLLSRLLGVQSASGGGITSLQTLLQTPSSLTTLSGGSAGTLIQRAAGVLSGVFGGLLLLGLSLTLAYALLERDAALSDGFATLAGGRDTTVYRYAHAVDADLESIFFGNLLFVVVMSVVATATYAATNLVAPAGLQIPMVVVLGFLTGVASLVPVVVGKLVYLPVVAYLGVQAARTGTGGLVFVGGVLVVYLLVLDLLPQSVVQPYVTGRQFDATVLLFAYILGPILFGWYGFFLLPVVFVLMGETVRIVLPELLHGEPIRPDVSVAQNTGADPEEVRGDADQTSDSTATEEAGATQS